MKAEILAIGSELVLGQIIDTNTPYMAKCLAENGIELVQATVIGDDLSRMKDAIQEASHRSEIVITTGGLGPTEDDLTREAIAESTQRPLVFQPHLMELIEAHVKRRGFRMTASNRKQAYVPDGAIPIENPKGMAPGFIVEGPNGTILSIPGVPSEMEYLMENAVIPYLRKRFNLQHQVIRYKVLRVCGLGESGIGVQIQDLMKESKNPTVGTLAAVGDVRIRITAKADHTEEASSLIERMERKIRNRLGPLIYGVDNETLHGNTMKALERSGFTLSVVETTMGGVLSQKFGETGSHFFLQGMVLPSDFSQSRFLNISTDEFNSLAQDLSRFTDRLARRCREECKTDLGFALHTKIMEKQGDETYRIENHYSLSTPTEMENQEYSTGGEPGMVRERAAIMALDMLRKYLLNKTQVV